MIWDVFFSSLALSAVLVGIHTYFGREIIRRGIIFADIAVAQLSGLGIALSLLFLDGKGLYLLSLSFALFASLIIGLSQRLKEYAEAFIGLLYAFGFSSSVLVFSLSPHGTEELKRLTAGDILFVPFSEVIKVGVLYAFVFLLLHIRRYLNSVLKELFFFVLFSLTLASSVKLVGVIVVFTLLVSPALVSMLFKKGLMFAWIWGVLWSSLSVLLSFLLDLPTGYTLAFLHAFIGIVVFLVRVFW